MVTRIPTRMAMAFTTAATMTRMIMGMMRMITTATTVATRMYCLVHTYKPTLTTKFYAPRLMSCKLPTIVIILVATVAVAAVIIIILVFAAVLPL
jgi:hypothetical protein